MNLVKKTFALLAAVASLIVFAACSNGEQKGTQSEQTSAVISSVATSSQNIQSQNPNKKPPKRESSSTESESVKVPLGQSLEIGMHGFTPDNCDNIGKDKESRYEEFEAVVKSGYVNTLCVGYKGIKDHRLWEIVIKYDLTVWLSAWSVYDPEKKTFEQYSSYVRGAVNFIKDIPQYWERFNGFWYDEKGWRGQTNDAMLEETKTYYKWWGKRNFAVLATGEYTGIEGNEEFIGTSADEMKKVQTYSLEYMTDIAFDSYGIDVRDGVDYSHRLKDWQKKISPNVIDGRTYYYENARLLRRLVGHDVNFWYYPCGYKGVQIADEDYCLAHLNFFDKLLKDEPYPGGLFIYIYKNGIDTDLIIRDENNQQLVYPDRDKWVHYSQRLQQLVKEYRNTKAPRAKLNV